MRVLVTGSSGHVGRAITASLRDAGHDVIGLSRSGGASEAGRHLASDISDPKSVDAIIAELESCDAVVHTAARLGKDPLDREVVLTNCLGTQLMLAAAQKLGATRFVYVSGVNVIGEPRRVPITEDHPTSPTTTYHASKLFGEHLVAAASGILSGVTLRLTSPAGPGLAPGRIMSVFAERALTGEPIVLLGQGSRTQNYVDVRDVGAAVVSALGSTATGVFNVAGAASLSNLELAEACIAELASSSPITPEGTDPEEGMRWEVSIDRASADLGWEPRFSAADSIRAIAEDVGS